MLRIVPAALPLCLSLVLSGCAGKTADATQPAPDPIAQEGGGADKAAPKFENPGGMWMPFQMAAHADTLRALGLEYDPAALTDPTAHPLGAVVSLGGCSASFIRGGLHRLRAGRPPAVNVGRGRPHGRAWRLGIIFRRRDHRRRAPKRSTMPT